MSQLLSRILLLACCLLSSQLAPGQSRVYQTTRTQNADGDRYLTATAGPFYHGVASGDPTPTAVVIWTRVTPANPTGGSEQVNWEMATDVYFNNVVISGAVLTDTSRDYTVKIDVRNLQPDTYYFYRFRHQGQESLIGRTKTTPAAGTDRIRLGVISCSDYRQGFFTALGNLAARNDLDAILHTGDYIYEGGGGPPEREHEPNFEVYRLQDYRQRLSQYRLDSNLQRCHQLYPWIQIWDDHDIVVDALRDTSFRHNAAQHGLYSVRKRAAIRAFREWLPVRDPDMLQANFYKNWRHLPFGDLMDLYLLDVRLYDRDRFAVDINDTLYGSPNAKLLGPEQLDWINTELQTSTARWKLLGNQLQMSHFTAAGVPLVMENWDGYPVERSAFFDNLENNAIDNVVVLTGDFHVSFANDIAQNPFNVLDYNPFTGDGAIAVEFIAPSITGDNFDEGNDFGLGSPQVAQTLIQSGNWHVKFVELTGHGYILLDLDQNRAQAEFWHMQDIDDPDNTNESLVATWLTRDGANHLEQGNGASPPNTNVPPPPPAVVGAVGTAEAEQQAVVLSLYPNPFHRFTLLNYVLPRASQVRVDVLDLQGRTVLQALDRRQSPGNYVLELDASTLPAGSYLLRLRTETGEISRTMVKVD